MKTLRAVSTVLLIVVLVFMGGYKFVTVSVLNYSTSAWTLWTLLSTIGLAWFLPKSSTLLTGLKGHMPLANRFGLTIGAMVMPIVALSALLPNRTTSPTRSIPTSVVEQYTYRGWCRERLEVRDINGTESLCLRYWGGRLHGFKSNFEPGDEVMLEVVDHWLGEVVVGIRQNGA